MHPQEMGEWVFPLQNRWKNSRAGESRHHVNESILQKAFKQAVAKAGFAKRATCHTCAIPLPRICSKGAMTSAPFKDCLATTRMISTHVLNRGGRDVLHVSYHLGMAL